MTTNVTTAAQHLALAGQYIANAATAERNGLTETAAANRAAAQDHINAARLAAKLAINADVWAESGGTGGMFAGLWRQGRLDIVDRDLTQAEQERLDAALATNFTKPIVDGD